MTDSPLLNLLRNSGHDFGSTAEGKEWCLKALHPAEPRIKCPGIPDAFNGSVVNISFEQSVLISSATTGDATATWGLDVDVLPHPVAIGRYRRFLSSPAGSGTIMGDPTSVLNTNITGPQHAEKMANFLKVAEYWRLAFCSCTATLVCNDLNNQGSVIGVQTPFAPLTWTAVSLPNPAPPARIVCNPKVRTLQGLSGSRTDFMSYEEATIYPNKYTGQARDGCYLPLRLTPEAFVWQGAHTLEGWAPRPPVAGYCPDFGSTTGPILLKNDCYFPDFYAPTVNGGGLFTDTYLTSPLCNGDLGHICFSGMSPQASVRLVFRIGFEYRVPVTSPFLPLSVVSPAMDVLALQNYTLISRTLKDGFPASYNDWGKLWDVIKRAAKAVLPTVGAVFGPTGAAVGSGLASLIPVTSQTQIEESREAVKEALTDGPKRKGRKKKQVRIQVQRKDRSRSRSKSRGPNKSR